MVEILGAVCSVIAVAGVVLNNRKVAACFYLWIISNMISAGLHAEAGMYSLVIRDLIFCALAVEGAIKWRK